MRKILQAPGSGRRGAALVELAISMTLLLLLVFGMIEIGLVIKDKLALNQVAREAARCAALGGSSALVATRVSAWANNVGLDETELLSEVEYTNPVDGSPAASPPPPGSDVTVTLTYNYHPISGILPGLPDPTILTATMVMRLE